MYAHRASFYPVQGMDSELTSMLEEGTQSVQAEGVRAVHSSNACGPDYLAFHLLITFDGLATVERYREEQREAMAQLGARDGVACAAADGALALRGAGAIHSILNAHQLDTATGEHAVSPARWGTRRVVDRAPEAPRT